MLVGFGLEGKTPSDLEERNLLARAGCTRTFFSARDGLLPDAVVDFLRPGDILVVTELRRLGTSLRDLVLSIERLHRSGAGLTVVHDPIAEDGEAIIHLGQVCSLLAAFSRSAEARPHRKVKVGRPAVLTPEEQARARKLLERSSVRQVAAILGVSAPTLYRYFPRRRASHGLMRPAVADTASDDFHKKPRA